ncbi:MAG: hypothetical protein O3A10_12510 [Chloroflexi bacterium]|nr:hypothetical protein [Chloroflexota bacterium]MDA1146209.1 hypothetical protein [Chloroflexota bacterium]
MASESTETSESGGAVRGRPVMGAVFGLLFGIFLSLSLLQMSVYALDSALVLIVPIVMLGVGGVYGFFAPLRVLKR